MREIIIDEEFKSLLPALDNLTYGQLKENLIQYGCREPLALWDGVLVDGYNRYAICTEHDIPFNTVDMAFNSREEATIWIIKNQVSRRNLTPMQMSFYRGLHYKSIKKIITNEKGTNQHNEVDGQNDHQANYRSTASILAKQYHISPKTILRDALLTDAINAIGDTSPISKKNILTGEVSISKKFLQGLSAGTVEDIAGVSASIEDGTYAKAKPVKAAAGSDEPASADAGDSNGAGENSNGDAGDSSGSLGDNGDLGDTGGDNVLPFSGSVERTYFEMHPLASVIARTMDKFSGELYKFNEDDSAEEVRMALRSFIDHLDNIYRASVRAV